MTWADRLQPAAYESPSGVRTEFSFENVNRYAEKLTTATEFPDFQGTHVQDRGGSGLRLPLRVFIHGSDHDLAADAFFDSLRETGPGTLDHPRYGRLAVVPFGRITQRDDLKSAAGQTVFEVTFYETTGVDLPESSGLATARALATVAEFREEAPSVFEAAESVGDTGTRVSLRDRFNDVLARTRTTFGVVVAAVDAASVEFNAIADDIARGTQVFIGDPLATAFQTGLLLQIPGQTAALAQDRFAAYRDLLHSLDEVYTGSSGSRSASLFRADELFASQALAGWVESALVTDYESRGAAVSVALDLLAEGDRFAKWRDDNVLSLGVPDTGAAAGRLLAAVSQAAGALVAVSFGLLQEHALVLDRPRSPLDLESEFYGTTDENLDRLILTSDLVGVELLEVPAGRRVVYFR